MIFSFKHLTPWLALIVLTASLALHAEMLDKAGSYTPSVTFTESNSDYIVTLRDPFDPTFISHEQRSSRSTSSTIVANITGIVLSEIDTSTAFSLQFGNLSTNFTLGDIPTYVKGQTTAFYCWNGWGAANKLLGTTGVRLTWTSTRLTVVVTMANEVNRPSPIVTDTAIAVGPGAFKDELPLLLSFHDQSMTTPRKVYASGSASIKNVIYGPTAEPTEQFSLNFASVTGTLDNAAPVISLLTPKQGASVGAAVTLTGRVTDAYGVEVLEWAIDPVNGPWTPSDTLDVVTQPAGAVWGATTMSWTAALTGIPPGTHKYYLRAKDPSGNISAPFLVTLLNPLPQITVGRWDAVLQQTNATDLRGALLITLASNGTWTGRLTIEGSSHSIGGGIDRTGALLAKVTRTGKPDLIVKGSIASFTPATMDLASITGTVEENSIALASWNALRSPFSSANLLPAGFVGRFNCTIAPITGTTGIGYLSIAITNTGAATITNFFADGSTLTWSGFMSAAHTLPVFISFYAGKGSASGTLSIDDVTHTVPAATLRWFRPQNHTDKQFASGWNELVTVSGALYTPPLAGTRVMGLTTLLPRVDLTWSGDGVTGTSTQRFTIATTNIATPVPSNLAGATIVFTPSTGLCSGVFKMLPGTVLATWRGAIIGTHVSGCYIAPAVLPAVQKRYGRIDLTPVP